MRAVLAGDLDAAVAVVIGLPPKVRGQVVMELIEQAHVAHKFNRRTGQALACFGTGSLMTAAQGRKAVLPHRCDARYCEALQSVLWALGCWRQGQARRAGHIRV